MSRRALFILLGALVVLGLIVMVGTGERREGTGDRLLLPALSARLNELDRIVVTTGGNRTVATLVRNDEGWVVEEKKYPADVANLRRNLMALSEARIVEEKTSNEALYDRLGVQDVSNADARGVLLTLEGGDPEPLAVIVGDTGVSGSKMAYARLPGEATSWLVSADLDLGRSTVDWLDREITDVAGSRVHAVTITHPDGSKLRIHKDKPGEENFAVDLPPGRTLNFEGVANGIGAALAGLELEDVQPRSALGDEPGKPVVARFETFDGLVVEVSTWNVPDGQRLTFSASTDEALAKRFAAAVEAGAETGDESERENLAAPDPVPFEEVRKQAEALNARTAGWVYTIPSFKAEQLTRRITDISGTG